ncbi:MAG: alpha-ribazole phosphatase [Saprospiraceae bacterium]|jgi:alpha-ribazole phosphatase
MNETLVDFLRDGDVFEANASSVFLGATDLPLTKAGRASMLSSVEGGDWDFVLSSPLKRCASVARAIAKRRGIPCKIKKELAEYHYGSWENQLVSSIISESPQLFEAFMQDPFDSPPPKATPYQAFHDNVLVYWQALLKQYAGQKILVVTHGGPMRSILGEVLAMSKQANLRIEVPAACFTRIRSLGKDWPTMLVFHNAQSVRIPNLEKHT